MDFRVALVREHDTHQPPVRRITKLLPVRQFRADESEIIVIAGVEDGGLAGLESLDDDGAPIVAADRAPAAARDLANQLESSLGRAEVGDRHGEVGVEHAHELHIGEIEAFGDHLRADQEIDLAAAKGVEGSLVIAGVVHGVGVHALDAQRGEFSEELIFRPLRALSEVGEAGLAEGAALGEHHGGEAVVALDGRIGEWANRRIGDLFFAPSPARRFAGSLAVDDHGGVAVVAHEDPVAAGAEDVVGVAAAVEEEDGLFFLLEGLFEVVLEGGGEDVEAAAFFGLAFHVDDEDAGHLGAEGAGGEGEELPIFVGVGVVPGFEGGGGGAEEDGDVEHLGAADGDVAAVVFGEVVLFVGGVVFFVDDDEAEVGGGGEDGGACADDDLRPAGGDGVLVLVAFGVFHAGVEDGDAGEAGGEAADGLRGEGNFGDEDDGGFVLGDDFFDGADVEFGFAGAGDAVDEADGEASIFFHEGGEGGHGGLLVGGEG